MTMTTEHCYIVCDPSILSGEPIIKGTRTPVRAIVEQWRLGVSPDEIPAHLPHLTLAQVFDALSYFSDHQDQIQSYIEKNRISDDLIDPRGARLMSRLFIQIYLDEDVDTLIAKLIRSRGFVARTTQEARQLGRSDPDQLDYAIEHQMTLLSHNRADFERLAQEYSACGRMHHGIIVAVRRPPREIARRLLGILNHVTGDEMQNRLRYI